MKVSTQHKFLLHLPSSLREASWVRNKNEFPLQCSTKLLATKQSPFANQLTRVLSKVYKNHIATRSEQFEVENPHTLIRKQLSGFSTSKDCFVDAATIRLVQFCFYSKLRLAMTKCSDYGLNYNFRPLTKFCEGW
jgi:hypothetical protein